MTQDELDALPEDGRLTQTVETKGDVTLVTAVSWATVGALFQPEDEPASVVDSNGVGWMIGYANGIRYKRRLQS